MPDWQVVPDAHSKGVVVLVLRMADPRNRERQI